MKNHLLESLNRVRPIAKNKKQPQSGK